jgi:DNA-binding PadR family transcriptional regulator
MKKLIVNWLKSVIEKIFDYETLSIVFLVIANSEVEIYGLNIFDQANLLIGKENSIGKYYPKLSYLEKSGYIFGEFKENIPSGGPRRRYYKLTSEGCELFFIMNLFLA